MDKEKSIKMSCEQFDSHLSEYIDGELDSVTVAAMEAHMSECEACRHNFEQLRDICAAVADTSEPLPDGLHRRIMAGVRAEARIARRRRLTSAFGIGAAAVLCIGILATATVRRMSSVDDDLSPKDNSRTVTTCSEENENNESIDAHAADPASDVGTRVYSADKRSSVITPAKDTTPSAEPTAPDATHLADETGPAIPATLSGTWECEHWVLTLTEDKHFTLIVGDGRAVSGDFLATDELITLSFDGNTAVYRVSLERESISFTYVSGFELLQ